MSVQHDDESEALSPAERFARSQHRNRYPLFTEFEQTREFRLDPFQIAGCQALEEGRGVLVCAPTGAGKTIVGEFAVARALAIGGKCFYTTPIKALSNQKYADLVAEHGSETVGLLTGDTSINSHAPVVVMTTEVLRNMLYAGSHDLVGLSAVVMDEVHYLADKFRGPVWEEVILHLAQDVQVVGLSATVSNAEEFGAWLQQVRGDTAVIVDEHRPVPLWQHMLVGRRMFDLFATGHDAELAVGAPPGSGGQIRIDPALSRAVSDAEARLGRASRDGGGQRGHGGRGGPQRLSGHKPPSRVDVIERLDGAGLLPAITFIFSRAGCEAAVAQCVRSRLQLVTQSERQRIRAVVDRRVASLPEADLAVLGYWEWREALELGIAAHHAGMLPAFKETVEELFVEGLVKAVFATETLALGINMPARTVVLERLVKYNGEGHVDLTPGEYTQLTGRAGRRGIDIEGHAVVVWAPGVDPRQVGGLASRRTYPLRSSFAPSYNMAVNLTDRLGRVAAKELLQQSFAQFQSDAGVSGLARQVNRSTQAAADAAKKMQCHLGDVEEYGSLLAQLSAAEKDGSRSSAARRREDIATDLAQLKRGDVIAIPSGRRAGLAVVLDPGLDDDGEGRPLVVTIDRWSGRLGQADIRGPLPALGRIKLAKHVNHRSPQVRKDLAATIRSADITVPDRPRRAAADPVSEAEMTSLRAAVRRHPVHGCADRHDHLQWWRRRQQTLQEADSMRGRVDGAKHSLGDHLDRILALLEDLGYVRGDELTDTGRMLSRIWSESDLLAAECLRAGVWDGLTPPQLAAAVSALVYSARRDQSGSPPPIPGPAGFAVKETSRLRRELNSGERDRGLPLTRDLDTGFAEAVQAWAGGETLADALEIAGARGIELPAGDFVRWCRQVVDLLDQIRVVAAPELATTARAAVDAIRRGVVSLGSV
ncbi:MAG: DEAD/DEAH box helicase [Nakamurella sp.]